MAESLDDLYARWQRNPDVSQTVALCDALRGSRRQDLVEIVGSHAARQLDVGALTAAARMYADTGRYDDAQQVLIAAGRLAPRDGNVYRWLGEVLLRRGDAERAEKVLERALTFGGTDASVLLDRARALLPTQRSSGMMAVAEEVAKQAGHGPSGATLGYGSPDSTRTEARNGNGAHRNGNPPPGASKPARAKMDSLSDDVDTLIRGNQDVKAALEARAPAPVPAAGRPSVEPPSAPLPSFDDPTSFGTSAGRAQTAAMPFSSNPLGDAGTGSVVGLGLGPSPDSSSTLSAQGSVSAATVTGQAQPLPPPPPDLPVNPFLVPPKAPRPTGPGGEVMPEARDVLDALHVAGVFEPDGAVRPQAFQWDKPEKGKRRLGSYATLIGLAVAIVGGASGTFYYVTDKRAKQHVEAEGVLAKVDADLRASEVRLLEPSEKEIARAFDLESRSPHAALTWLHERAMVGLLRGGADVAFEDGTQRAKEVGVEEKRVAFAYVASFLFQGDTAGAAAALAKWDGKADDDAFYQLVAGATFERAGDPRALERYAAAVKLAPDLLVAQILQARATAVDGDPRRAAELARELRTKHPDRLEGAALLTLAWARDPMRGEPPAEAKEIVDKADLLPVPLKAVPHAARALLALEQHKVPDAKAALQQGLAVADTPGIASWLGSIALSTGDEGLARKGALTAVSFSAVYAPARMLAARVALLGARLYEALKATEELPPQSVDVGVVTAAVSYEKLDGERMSRALEALPDDARKVPFLAPLLRGQQLLAGSATIAAPDKVMAMAGDDAPWADLVAMDAALDVGDLDLARKAAAQWQGDVRPLRAVRLARLARYDGKLDEADRLSKLAMEGGTVTVRALTERVFVLVAANKSAEALALFKQHPNVGGPLAKWLRAYASASHGKPDEARASLSQEDPPPPLAPMPARMIAASAYGAVKDSRHGGDYVKAIVQAGFQNPDMAAAAEKVGAGKLAPRRR